MEIQIHNFPAQLTGRVGEWETLARQVAEDLGMEIETLNIVFVDDETLQKMHLEYLNDPDKTDVITFDLSEGDKVEAEIYISSERADAQALEYGVTFSEEVLRLIIHGLLHLKGYDDLEPEKKKIMKQEEEKLVSKFRNQIKKLD